MIELIASLVVYVILCYFVANRINKVRLRTIQLFLINLFLTPIGGIIFVQIAKSRLVNSLYHFKCPRCEYYFTEELSTCPLCEKEGIRTNLEKVKILLT